MSTVTEKIREKLLAVQPEVAQKLSAAFEQIAWALAVNSQPQQAPVIEELLLDFAEKVATEFPSPEPTPVVAKVTATADTLDTEPDTLDTEPETAGKPPEGADATPDPELTPPGTTQIDVTAGQPTPPTP
jgi:hypothetical protein